jgi:ligand-binding sensor domain-containing protein/serine phosphatase RsbU (regulator of sigma subunit)
MSVMRKIKHRTKVLVWLILLIQLEVSQAGAQKYYFDNYSIKQGLSGQQVYSLLQDSKDFIWLGTANGLSRFDGKKFENYSSRNGLAPGGVRCMAEDSLGHIWFGHMNGGISRFDGQVFEQAVFDSILVTGDVTSITLIRDNLWFTTRYDGAIRASLPVADIKHIKARQFLGKDGLSDQVFGSSLLRSGDFVCVVDVGMRKYKAEDAKFENYRMPHMTTYFNPTCLMEDIKGDIWFGTYNGGIYKYIMSESRMEVIDLPRAGVSSNWITCLTEDSKGSVWAGTWGGGIAVIEHGTIRKFDKENGLNASKIYSVIEDAEGNILIADKDNGLTIYKGDAFVTINEKEILPDQNVNAICEDKTGAVWFGTNAGISRYFPRSDKKPVVYNQGKYSKYQDVRFFREDRNDNLWMGTKEDGVILYNIITSKFETQPYINSIDPMIKQVTAMEIDKEDNLWIGTAEGGIAYGKINTKNFTWKTNLDSLTVIGISALYCDPDGDMWIGTERMGGKAGIIKYIAKSKEFKRIRGLSGIIPKTLVMDSKGILWIGTSEGLKSFVNDSINSTLTQDDGLLSNNILLLSTGSDGCIYIGTNKGLNRYFPESKKIYSYTERNGFTGIETKSNAVFKSSDGDLWFGTANGAILFKQERASFKEEEPLTHILGLQVNYKPRAMIPGMKLRNSEHSILFDYYSICLTNPDVVKYKVKLEGADEVWQPVTEMTWTNYPALSPGKYRFMVVACNSQGIWNRKPVTFSFIIRPPFYLTWWFVLISVLLIIVIVVVYIKIREKNLINEKIILEEKVEERTAEVVQKSVEIEEKNRDITASIRYAERIQRSMLPREDTFPETFVLFMPKDIVSGDFYWMYDDGVNQYIAACDCTGHGVPGAFMSIIGHNSLDKVVREYGITRPAAILDQLNTEVLKTLMQRNEETINDGMDMALISFGRKKFSLDFAGAFNPLYVVRKGEVFVYRGDRFPIGMTAIGDKKNFSNHSVDIQPGDMIYMCSDGYADQFGPNGKKFKSGNVKKLLSDICDLPVKEQRDRLREVILDWMGESPQVDDIMFIGKRITAN